MPEKILAAMGLKKFAFLGMLAMVKPVNGEVNWKAFGLLIAILVPFIAAVGIGGIFVGEMSEVPEELKRIEAHMIQMDKNIDVRLDHIETDMAVVKEKIK